MQAAATGALSAAERSLPTSEVRGRGRSREDAMPKGSGKEELPHILGQGQWPRVPDCNSAGMAERSYPCPRSGGSPEEIPSVRGQGW